MAEGRKRLTTHPNPQIHKISKNFFSLFESLLIFQFQLSRTTKGIWNSSKKSEQGYGIRVKNQKEYGIRELGNLNLKNLDSEI